NGGHLGRSGAPAAVLPSKPRLGPQRAPPGAAVLETGLMRASQAAPGVSSRHPVARTTIPAQPHLRLAWRLVLPSGLQTSTHAAPRDAISLALATLGRQPRRYPQLFTPASFAQHPASGGSVHRYAAAVWGSARDRCAIYPNRAL